ncbi:hypothetical protein Ahy_B06g081225 isoform A [Arachis hypogaea]|uniref:RING-type domain-containing protein n=1 Tax=Arachis hypogaea TaxID=3818 RepID=A0A444YKG5_ARAHY|nr:hypothetical protein Ahy_B06g081225 isoform A [Arachis hypogaea]
MVMAKVKRQKLQACITCPLCHKLLRDATTISLCLHTFCRKCIYKKLSDDEMDCCPVCYVDLGCLPLQKLRPDHNLQDIRAKIFPFRRRKIDAPQVVPSITLPAKRKERSLSSLVVNAPKVSNQTGFTGKRTKSGTRKAAEETYGEHNLGSFVADPSKKRPNEDTENSMELAEGKGDLWTPLNCLVEAANRTKSSKSNSQGTPHAKLESPSTAYGGLDMVATTTKSDLPTSLKSAFHMVKTKIKDNRHKRFGADKEGHTLHSGSAVKQKRPLRPVQERAEASETSASDTTGSRCDGKNSPIWFSLVASEDQKGDVPLPQISACYLRIKTWIVEIMCRGQPVLPNLQLHNLVDLWFCSGSTTKKMPASVGSSAKDFVMVLSYCRKVYYMNNAALYAMLVSLPSTRTLDQALLPHKKHLQLHQTSATSIAKFSFYKYIVTTLTHPDANGPDQLPVNPWQRIEVIQRNPSLDCIYSIIPSTVQLGTASILDVKGNNISTAPRLPLAAATCIGLTPS